MFNRLFREFEEDPFFSSASDPFRAQRERMLRDVPEHFGGGVAPRTEPGRDLDHFRNPFTMMDNMMAGMRQRMEEMHRNFENMSTDSNGHSNSHSNGHSSAHSFSSSSVMTYSKVGDEPAKVFQASTQTRCAPGGIKETRRAVRDSESGVQKMAIGHHIQDRGHVIEKKHNAKTGEREFNQDFENMDETEAQSFDEEWQRKVSRFQRSAPTHALEAPRQRAVHRAAIADSANTHSENKKPSEGKKKTHVSELNIQGSGMKKK